MVQQTDDVGGASAEADGCKSARLALMLQECEACIDDELQECEACVELDLSVRSR